MEERIGLIDIGSNTIRLVIFGYNKKTGLNEILNIKTPARLSQYLTKSNEMNDEGIHVLKETLSSFRKVADKFNVDALYPIATAAIRQSKIVKLSLKKLNKIFISKFKLYLKKMKHFTVTMRLHILLILKMEFLSISGAVLPKLPFSKTSNLKRLIAFHSAWYHLSVSFLVIKHTMTKQPLKIWNSFYVSNLVS